MAAVKLSYISVPKDISCWSVRLFTNRNLSIRDSVIFRGSVS